MRQDDKPYAPPPPPPVCTLSQLTLQTGCPPQDACPKLMPLTVCLPRRRDAALCKAAASDQGQFADKNATLALLTARKSSEKPSGGHPFHQRFLSFLLAFEEK